jgi:hypothetical protein
MNSLRCCVPGPASLRLQSLVLAALLVVLVGCSRSPEADAVGHAASSSRDAANGGRALAYEHSVDVEAAPDRVAPLHAAALAACRAATASGCTVLESRVDSEPEAAASLKFRARPEVIPTLVAVLGRKAELSRQSTRVEDLSGPIADTARQLAMLDDYRSRLEALRSRAGGDIDALIKVNRELAEVQSRYEAFDGKRAQLAQRVDTEILAVSIRSDRHRPFWAPIGRALTDFGGNLSQGISIAVSSLAYLLPWLFIVALAAWAARRLWRRRTRNGAEGRP